MKDKQKKEKGKNGQDVDTEDKKQKGQENQEKITITTADDWYCEEDIRAWNGPHP